MKVLRNKQPGKQPDDPLFNVELFWYKRFEVCGLSDMQICWKRPVQASFFMT